MKSNLDTFYCRDKNCPAENPQPVGNFHRNRKMCKSCYSKYCRRWAINNPEKIKAYSLKSRSRESDKKRRREYQKGISAERQMEYFIKYKYGISASAVKSILEKQGGVCAICREKETARNPKKRGGIKSLSIDHCHATGKVRGMLCYRCNVMIGMSKDSVFRLKSAILYLEKTDNLPLIGETHAD